MPESDSRARAAAHVVVEELERPVLPAEVAAEIAPLRFQAALRVCIFRH